ncbi:MAG: response regulator [Rhizobiales bacterium]|nr:response regulator [Hyphomicrobiales bacterium]MBN9009709.1 response regulator [Hyphomicrobiales bacterium]
MAAIDFSIPVLVVDDYRAILRIMQSLLRQLGFKHVDQAESGEEALAKMRARPYGLVISDLHMAPVDGMELLQTAKADAALKDARFLMITADLAPERVREAKDAGASGYMMKPFDAPTLRARIEGALAP